MHSNTAIAEVVKLKNELSERIIKFLDQKKLFYKNDPTINITKE